MSNYQLVSATDGNVTSGNMAVAVQSAAVTTDLGALTTLQAAMVVVGAGDNSANVTTMGTDLTTLGTDYTALLGSVYQGNLVVIVDISAVTTTTQLTDLMNRCYQALTNGSTLIVPG